MRVRHWYLALLVAVSTGLAGCCSEPWGGCYPHGKNWCGTSCGERMWHEWFSLPPQCNDPCDGCGNFIGPRLNDSLYSHGNDYSGWCERRDRGTRFERYDQRYDAANDAPPIEQPTPAAQPYYQDEFDVPGDPSARRRYPGRRMSYEQPVPHSGGRQMHPASNNRLLPSLLNPAVDSPVPSRTLARPQRTRLFAH